MDKLIALATVLLVIVGIGVCILFGFLFYYSVKFIVTVPKHLKDIAASLEKIADKE